MESLSLREDLTANTLPNKEKQTGNSCFAKLGLDFKILRRLKRVLLIKVVMQKYPMTLEGAKALKDELSKLKLIERPRIIEAIATAREHGDLKENAEYHAAREEQSFTEGRIQELEAKLANANIIDISKFPNAGKVIFGATVGIRHLETDVCMTYKIVGEDESDLKINKISYNSPIARALIGKIIDDAISVETPGGIVEYEIISVNYVAV